MPAIIPPALAQGICNPALPWLPCGEQAAGGQVVGNIISALLGLLLIVAGLISFGFLVMGSLQWITSGGDKAQLEAARNKIVHAIIGLILVASTWAFVVLILNTFLGLSFPRIEIPFIGAPPRRVGPPDRGQPRDQTWYGCAQTSIQLIGCDNCVAGQRACRYTCLPNGCTWRGQGECQTQNQGSGQCPANCNWQTIVSC